MFGARRMDWMVVRVEAPLEEAQREGDGAADEAEVALEGGGEDFLPREWELSTQLIMQSQLARRRTMGIATTHGTVLVALSPTMGQDLISLGVRAQIIPENLTLLLVHGGQRRRNGEQRTGMKIFQRPRSSLPPMCLQCLCLQRM